MDARLDVYRILGLRDGEAHVIRNAGGVVTGDEIRSLAISQRLLGTREIILIHHTDCGMLTFTDDDFQRAIRVRSSPGTSRCAGSSSMSRQAGWRRSPSDVLTPTGRGWLYTGLVKQIW